VNILTISQRSVRFAPHLDSPRDEKNQGKYRAALTDLHRIWIPHGNRLSLMMKIRNYPKAERARSDGQEFRNFYKRKHQDSGFPGSSAVVSQTI
jgi:hypothetical protein